MEISEFLEKKLKKAKQGILAEDLLVLVTKAGLAGEDKSPNLAVGTAIRLLHHNKLVVRVDLADREKPIWNHITQPPKPEDLPVGSLVDGNPGEWFESLGNNRFTFEDLKKLFEDQNLDTRSLNNKTRRVIRRLLNSGQVTQKGDFYYPMGIPFKTKTSPVSITKVVFTGVQSVEIHGIGGVISLPVRKQKLTVAFEPCVSGKEVIATLNESGAIIITFCNGKTTCLSAFTQACLY